MAFTRPLVRLASALQPFLDGGAAGGGLLLRETERSCFYSRKCAPDSSAIFSSRRNRSSISPVSCALIAKLRISTAACRHSASRFELKRSARLSTARPAAPRRATRVDFCIASPRGGPPAVDLLGGLEMTMVKKEIS